MGHLVTVVEQFDFAGHVVDVQPYGSGNLNDTFLVTLDADCASKAILQRINQQVFRRPELIMLNLRTFMDHIRANSVPEARNEGRRWELPDIISTLEGEDYFVDGEGGFWRALSFIDGARTYDTVQDRSHAREVGYALGKFHSLISDLDPARLYDTLEGFHVTPRYLAHYDTVLERGVDKSSPEIDYGLAFVAERRLWASVLEDAVQRGELQLRTIHGDPKVNNIMIEEASGHAVSIVDLDTVKPGLVHYDIGDCLRSCCNPAGEETTILQDVRFETDLCRAILEGYMGTARRFLTDKDYDYLYDSVRLIAFELGLRFFTDYLEGDVYFKAKHPEHNLHRAMVQVALVEKIEAKEQDIREIVSGLRA